MDDAADDLEMQEISQQMGVGFCKRHNPELGLWPHECPQCRQEVCSNVGSVKDTLSQNHLYSDRLEFGNVVINRTVSHDNPIRVLIFLREQGTFMGNMRCLCLTGNGDIISLSSNFLRKSGSIDLDIFYRVRFEELGMRHEELGKSRLDKEKI